MVLFCLLLLQHSREHLHRPRGAGTFSLCLEPPESPPSLGTVGWGQCCPIPLQDRRGTKQLLVPFHPWHSGVGVPSLPSSECSAFSSCLEQPSSAAPMCYTSSSSSSPAWRSSMLGCPAHPLAQPGTNPLCECTQRGLQRCPSPLLILPRHPKPINSRIVRSWGRCLEWGHGARNPHVCSASESPPALPSVAGDGHPWQGAVARPCPLQTWTSCCRTCGPSCSSWTGRASALQLGPRRSQWPISCRGCRAPRVSAGPRAGGQGGPWLVRGCDRALTPQQGMQST